MEGQLTSVEEKPTARGRLTVYLLAAFAVVSLLGHTYDLQVLLPRDLSDWRWLLAVPPFVLPAICYFVARNHHEDKLAAPVETERQQAVVRIAMGTVVLNYFAIESFAFGLNESVLVILTSIVYYDITWAFLIWILLAPTLNIARRIGGMVADNGLLSLSFLGGGATLAPLWPAYLWIALGNGFRYGVSSLIVSSSLAVLGFGLAAILNAYWRADFWQTSGEIIALVVIPAYVISLIRQLHTAIAAANKANAAKTRFMAVMSHELRTPLSAMLGTVGVLRNSSLDEDQRQLLHLIGGSGRSLLSMINELLDFSAIESGKVHLDVKDVEIYDLLVTTVNTLATAAHEKGLTLKAHIDCRLPRTVQTDSEHVRRIITNLVWNAIKFTKAGRIDVSVLLIAGRDRVAIEIQDTGVGIPAEKQARIFDPFVQGDDRVERAYEGVGLGLAIVRELVSVHRGQISLKSQVGVGSQFRVELPVGFAPPEAPSTPQPQVGDRVTFVAGSSPLAGGGLLEACRALGLSCTFVDADPVQLRNALDKAKAAAKPLVFLSHRDMSTGVRLSPERFEELASVIEAGRAVPILIPHDSDSDEALEAYRTRAAAMIRSPGGVQLGNALYFADLDTPTHGEAVTEDYRAEKVCRLLLVEDNATNRLITGRAMTEAGHQVTAVPSGDEALNALDKDTFDVIIMDINMPGLNGFETTKIIRAVNYSDKLKIIGLTADVTSETKRRCLEAGMDVVLTKPASTAVMLKAIDDLVTHGVTTAVPDKVTSIEASSRFRARRAAVVDDAGFQRLKEIGGPSFILESVTLFLAEAVDLIGELEEALNAYDRARAFEIFHSLKGICANVGAMRLRETVNTLRDSDSLISDRARLLAKLRDELGTFQTEVSKKIPELQAMSLPFG